MSYNLQTAVDSATHLIWDFDVKNYVADYDCCTRPWKAPGKILEAVVNKGCENTEDTIRCLENGIIPDVIMNDGEDGYELEMAYYARCRRTLSVYGTIGGYIADSGGKGRGGVDRCEKDDKDKDTP